MAKRMTAKELDKRCKFGLTCISDGKKMYHFYQQAYYNDFKAFLDEKHSLNKTYEAIAGILNNNPEKDISRTINRYHDTLLFGKPDVSESMGAKLADMLFDLEDSGTFNPQKHKYMEEVPRNSELNQPYQWDDVDAKWNDIIGYSDTQKNAFIAGHIMEIINQMSISDFYTRKPDGTFTDREYWDDQISEIYRMISELYMMDDVKKRKWFSIMNQIRDMVHRCDFPGIYDQTWIEANEAITYFDVAYDIATDEMALFKKINDGKTAFRFTVKVTKDMLERRKRYKERIAREDKLGNAHRTDVMLLEEEMRTALTNILSKMNN